MKVGPSKNAIFRAFTIFFFFFRTTGLQFKLLILIESLNIFHWKPTTTTTTKKMGVFLGQNLGQIRSNVVRKVKKLALSAGFHILHGEYI